MSYNFYFGKELLPVAPPKLNTKIKNKNKTITLINEGEVNLLKTAGLTEYKFDLLLPNVPYPFAEYLSGFKPAGYYLKILENLKIKKEQFQFIVTRTTPDGRNLFRTNTSVTLENYDIKEDTNEGIDVIVSVELKQYQFFATIVVPVNATGEKKSRLVKKNSRPTKNPASGTKYTVNPGDCLFKIARKKCGDEKMASKIYAANKSVIEAAAKKYRKGSSQNGRWIYPGTVLKIP